jgi:hypothetical protein
MMKLDCNCIKYCSREKLMKVLYIEDPAEHDVFAQHVIQHDFIPPTPVWISDLPR